MGFQATHLAGGEVGDDGDALSDEFFRGVELGDAGEYLAAFGAQVDLEAEEFVGLGDAFGDDDLYVIAELPGNLEASAISLAVGASGAARIKTTVLLSPKEVDAAIKVKVGYRAPGA